MPKKLTCACCGEAFKPKGAKTDYDCAGCGKTICDGPACAAGPWGEHEPWQHRPCDECGEPVAVEGASNCLQCMEL